MKFPKWSEYKGKRISCDDCIIDLAEHRARFMSEPAAHVRLDANGSRYYCSRHAHRRKVTERGP